MMRKICVVLMVFCMAGLMCAGQSIVPGMEYEVDTTTNTVSIIATLPVYSFEFSLVADAGNLNPGGYGPGWFNPPDPIFCPQVIDPWIQPYPNRIDGIMGTTGTATGVMGLMYWFGFSDASMVAFCIEEEWGLNGATICFEDGRMVDLNGLQMTVPEPATILLLGLGGLLLRRK